MKFSLIVAVVMVALAQGSLAQDTDLSTIQQQFEDLKNKLSTSLGLNADDLAGQAQNIQTRLEPLVVELQEKFKTFTAQIQAQVEPMTTNPQAPIKAMADELQKQLEAILQRVTEQARAIAN